MSYTVEPKSSKDVERRSVGAIRLVDYRRKAVDGRVAYVRKTLSIYNKNFCNAAEFVTVERRQSSGGHDESRQLHMFQRPGADPTSEGGKPEIGVSVGKRYLAEAPMSGLRQEEIILLEGVYTHAQLKGE